MKSRLIKHAADLLTKRMSEIRADYPRSMPVWVLKDIEAHNERLRFIAIDLRKIADGMER